jgi:Holliday junction resolvase
MTIHRRAARRDLVEDSIVATLERCGWTVERLSIAGGPDLLAGRQGITELLECKTGKRKVQANQTDWHARWRGRPVKVLRTVADVLRLSGIRDEEAVSRLGKVLTSQGGR